MKKGAARREIDGRQNEEEETTREDHGGGLHQTPENDGEFRFEQYPCMLLR